MRRAVSASRRLRAETKLAALAALGSRLQGIVSGTLLETRVPKELWLEFVDVVESHNVDVLEGAIRSWARGRTQRGPISDWYQPLVRAVTRARFVAALRAQTTTSGSFLPRSDAEDLVDELSDARRWKSAKQRGDDLGLRIGTFTLWATFSVDPRPYAGLPRSATGIASSLGWDDSATRGIIYKGDRPLLLMEYVPTDRFVRFPTMIEAWATEPLNYYFTPSPPTTPWGLTRPWASASPALLPRPEVVHAAYPLGSLRSAIKTI